MNAKELKSRKEIGAMVLYAFAMALTSIGLALWTNELWASGAAAGIAVSAFGLSIGKSRAMRLRTDTSAVSPVIGVILMVAITVVLATIVFVLVSNLSSTQDDSPRVAFQKDETGLTIIQAPTGQPWADFVITGCDTYPTEGNLSAGQTITDCLGDVVISHTPTNSVIYSTKFE